MNKTVYVLWWKDLNYGGGEVVCVYKDFETGDKARDEAVDLTAETGGDRIWILSQAELKD